MCRLLEESTTFECSSIRSHAGFLRRKDALISRLNRAVKELERSGWARLPHTLTFTQVEHKEDRTLDWTISVWLECPGYEADELRAGRFPHAKAVKT